MVLLPGGGYTGLMTEKEGGVEARWLNDHGVSAYILQYRLGPAYTYPWPMVDCQRAVRFVRSHAAEWGLRADAIGVWGFSAGGHLASYLATADPHGDASLQPEQADKESAVPKNGDAIDSSSARVDFAVVSYGLLSVDPSLPGSFTLKTLVGKHPSPTLVAAVNPIAHVSKASSPTFLYATEDDAKISSAKATLFFNALQRAGVSAELHISRSASTASASVKTCKSFQSSQSYPRCSSTGCSSTDG